MTRTALLILLNIAIAASDVPARGEAAVLPAEHWVFAQLRNNRPADLEARFPNSVDRRVLRATFLANLLVGRLNRPKDHWKQIVITNAVVEGAVHLRNEVIPYEIRLDGCEFRGGIDFSGSDFRRGASFQNAKFRGAANFIGTRLPGLLLSGAHFYDGKHGANFNGLRVDGTVSIEGVEFWGPVNFVHAQIGGQLQAKRARFASEREPGNLQAMTVGHFAIFEEVWVARSLQLEDSTFFSLSITGQHPEGPILPIVDVSRTTILHGFRIERVSIEQLIGTSMRVRGPASLVKDVIHDALDLRNSTFDTLDMSELIFPPRPENARLSGVTYKHIAAENNDALRRIPSKAAYSADVYVGLETFFHREGNVDLANDVFVDGKNRERQEILTGTGWLWSLFLYLLVRYGRSPQWALLWGLFLWTIGVVCFWKRERMEIAGGSRDRPPIEYSSLSYSLDLLLPLVDLDSKKYWRPKSDRPLALFYMRVLIISGWVLIPIGLFSLTGLIK